MKKLSQNQSNRDGSSIVLVTTLVIAIAITAFVSLQGCGCFRGQKSGEKGDPHVVEPAANAVSYNVFSQFAPGGTDAAGITAAALFSGIEDDKGKCDAQLSDLRDLIKKAVAINEQAAKDMSLRDSKEDWLRIAAQLQFPQDGSFSSPVSDWENAVAKHPDEYTQADDNMLKRVFIWLESSRQWHSSYGGTLGTLGAALASVVKESDQNFSPFALGASEVKKFYFTHGTDGKPDSLRTALYEAMQSFRMQAGHVYAAIETAENR
jgi:hypothetical protein